MAKMSDVFVFLDTVQFTRRDWRTRNRIKTPRGPLWLSIPVRQDGAREKSIDQIRIADETWMHAHLERIEHVYRRGAEFNQTIEFVRSSYAEVAVLDRLSDVNQKLMSKISAFLGLNVEFAKDTDLIPREELSGLGPSHRLAALCSVAGATHYLSGPSARGYLDERVLAARGVIVEWMNYEGLPQYPQLWGPFDPHLSILDALLTVGSAGAREALGC